jgi:hypothetical protein
LRNESNNTKKGCKEFVSGEGLFRDKKSAKLEDGRTVSVMSGVLDDDDSWMGQVKGGRKVRE